MFRVVIAVVLALCLLPVQLLAEESVSLSGGADVRLLIDISGSMKQNDPSNLRIPALKLVARLLPEGQRASVWTFGKQVNALVPPGVVNQEWRDRAIDLADKVNSVALYTNIGGVLKTASADLAEAGAGKDVHFILLTDGMVDISENAQANDAERANILGEVIQQFRRTGARIHTIALSGNADLNLMDKLARSTAGVSAIAETSEDLSRIFTEALDQAVPSEQVPLTGNRFSIDTTVEEFTALVFVRQGASPVTLVGPDGAHYRQGQHPGHVQWHHDHGYDLITVTRPEAGEWTLDADPRPGSRVTVVTDLRMMVDPLPASFYPGDELEIQASFHEKDGILKASELLGVIDVDVTISDDQNRSGTRRVSVPGQPPEDGVFREPIRRLSEMGRYLITVTADGKTFQRQYRQVVQLRSPMDVELEGTGSGDESRYRLKISSHGDHIQADQTHVQVAVNAPDGSRVIKTLAYDESDRGWSIELDAFGGEGRYQALVSLEGTSADGRSFTLQPDAVTLEFPRRKDRTGEYRSVVSPADTAELMAVVADSAGDSLASSETVEGRSVAANEPLASGTDELGQAPETSESQDNVAQEQATDNTEPAQALYWGWFALGGVVLLGSGAGAAVIIRRKRLAEPGTPGASVAVTTEQDQDQEQIAINESDAAEQGPSGLSVEDPDQPGGSLQDPGETAGNTDDEVIVDGKSAEEIADAILAENQQYQEAAEEEFGLEDFDISESDGLQNRGNGADNKKE